MMPVRSPVVAVGVTGSVRAGGVAVPPMIDHPSEAVESGVLADRCNTAPSYTAACASPFSPLPSVPIRDHVVLPTFCWPPSLLPALYPAPCAMGKRFFRNLSESVTSGQIPAILLSRSPSADTLLWTVAAAHRFDRLFPLSSCNGQRLKRQSWCENEGSVEPRHTKTEMPQVGEQPVLERPNN